MSEATGDTEAGPPGFLMLFDGPAFEQRVHTVVPPGPVRWFCRSAEMGSDKPMEWWVTAEEPPADESVEITEYRFDPGEEPVVDEESGDMVVHFTCDDTKWMGAPASFQSVEVPPDDPEIPRASFRAEDIAAMLIHGQWYDVPTAGRMYELILEPDDGPVKITTGANLVYEDDGHYIGISPQAVQGFKFRPSSVAQTPHLTPDGTLRVARDTFAAADAEIQRLTAEATTILIVEPNGEHILEPKAE